MTDTQQLVANLYRDERGDSILLTPNQDLIFRSIAKKEVPRLHIMCHTRYGKSLDVGLAVLTRAATFPEKWAIIAGTKEKAKIIMDYVIAHIFDNDFTKQRFVPEKGDDLEDIRRYRNKNHITFTVGVSKDNRNLYGEIFVGSAKEVLGFGAPNVVLDEAALVNNADFSLVLRMLGDNPHENFMVKIGNPFERNHFLESYHDPAFRKIVIDCYKSLQEGRITQSVIDENRPYPYFKILYECKFPSANEVDESGWMHLLSDQEILIAQKRELQPAGVKRLGIDVQRGGRNYNAWVVRTDNEARLIKKTIESDLIGAAETTVEVMQLEGIPARQVFVDDSGIGGGLVDILKMRGIDVNPINFGEKSEDETCLNMRASMYAGKEGLMSWIKQGGKLVECKDWIELTRIRYRKDMSGKTKLESKDDMRKRGIESPDVADALALTFASSKQNAYYSVDPAKILSGGVKPFYDGMPG